MPDANLTKNALANAFKVLLTEKELVKISINDICDKCGMNRKSFYYHFKDKYDLICWIFNTEFIKKLQGNEFMYDITKLMIFYFYDNRNYYKKVFAYQGQNSFTEYLKKFFHSMMKDDIESLLNKKSNRDFYTFFYADAEVCAISRWIIDFDYILPEEFYEILSESVFVVSKLVVDNFDYNNNELISKK